MEFKTLKAKRSESEKTTEKYLKNQVTKLGGVCYKWVSPNIKGVPDRICLLPGGKVAFIELKSEGEEPTKLQYYMIDMLTNLGFFADYADTKYRVDTLLEEILR